MKALVLGVVAALGMFLAALVSIVTLALMAPAKAMGQRDVQSRSPLIPPLASADDPTPMAESTGLKERTYDRLIQLRNNDDQLLLGHLTFLLLSTSFLAIAWITVEDSGAAWVRVAISILGLVLTILQWRVILARATALDDWRARASAIEEDVYGRQPDGHTDIAPYRGRPDAVPTNLLTRSVLYGLLFRADLGRPNIIVSRLIPAVIASGWVLAIAGALIIA